MSNYTGALLRPFRSKVMMKVATNTTKNSKIHHPYRHRIMLQKQNLINALCSSPQNHASPTTRAHKIKYVTVNNQCGTPAE